MSADGHAPTCPLVCCTSADDPAVTGVPLPKERWLGHRDLCSLQWGEGCDCPNGAEYLAEQRPGEDPAPIPASADELQTELLLAYAQGRWSDDTACLLVAAGAVAAALGADPIAKARALDLLRRAHEAVRPK